MIAENRPGWDDRRRATDLEGNARAAIELLDERGIERATVVGHSFGGAVACWLAAQAPDRVGALVLAAPSANTASLYRADRWLAAPLGGFAAAAATMTTTGAALSLGMTRRRLADRLGIEEDYVLAAARRLRSPGAWRSFAIEQRVLVRDLPVLEQRLGQIEAPTQIVVGSEDRVLPPGSTRRLAAQIRGARLSVLKGIGHLLPLRAPEQLAAVILAQPDRAQP